LLNGKRLRVKINKNATISVLVQHINASGDAGSEDYILSAGFPPKTLEDMSVTIEESGLAGSQVVQKKA
jgi:UBX domain-containing protein 1